MGSYDASIRRKVDQALKQVTKVLDTSRNPQHPPDVPHSYADKFQVVELSTQAAVATLIDLLGPREHLGTMQEWAAGQKAVTLRWEQTNKCSFDRTETRKVESDVQHVTESTMFGKTTEKTVTKVTEHFWNIHISWELFVYPGSDPKADKRVLYSGKGQHQIKTNGPEPVSPRKDITTASCETRLDWLLKYQKNTFGIKRDVKSCHTPARNDQVTEAQRFIHQYNSFAVEVFNKIQGVFSEQSGHKHDLRILSSGNMFQSVLAIFCFEEVDGEQGPTMTKDMGTFVEEQKRSWRTQCEQIDQLLPKGDGSSPPLITADLGRLSAAFHQARETGNNLLCCIQAVEDMMYDQIRAAVGKELTATDFGEYMDFHNRRLYRPNYRPNGFCYAIRRPDHYPEGTMAIEAKSGKDGTPIQVFTVHGKATEAMKFPLSAAADLSFYGDRYLHACILHQFGGIKQASLNLTARARQFSSFVLLVGKIGSADTFDPAAALIIQNKDDLTIPLLLETIPTAQEFRDAIESLSPEQQDFAKAFRAMQLASSVFGVMVIQIKPQMERLLKLPEDSLTKEVQLTQELMELFIKYQLSSDLLSYDGPEDASAQAKIARVREHAKVLRDMINEARSAELAEEKQSAQYMRAERATMRLSRSPPRGPPAPGGPPPPSPPRAMAMRCSAPAPPPAPAGAPPPPPPPKGLPHKRAAPAPPPAPAPQQQQQQQQQQAPEAPQQTQKATLEVRSGGGGGVSGSVDYTTIPNVLDTRFDELSEGSSVRPTIIKPGPVWRKKYQDGLIAQPTEMTLRDDEQRTQRDKAYDLLDALSRSGSLPVDSAELHVVLAATHCFEKMLLDTVIQDNVNPIEKAERSGLIMSTTIQNKPPADLIEDSHVQRLQGHSQKLFLTQS